MNNEQRITNTIKTILDSVQQANPSSIVEIEIKGYYQAGEWQGEIVLPIVKFTLKDKPALSSVD